MNPVPGAIYASISMLIIAALLSLYRLLRGPTLPDRVVALDLIASLVVGITIIYSIYTGVAVILDVGIVFALIAFLGTVAFASYIERKERS